MGPPAYRARGRRAAAGAPDGRTGSHPTELRKVTKVFRRSDRCTLGGSMSGGLYRSANASAGRPHATRRRCHVHLRGAAEQPGAGGRAAHRSRSPRAVAAANSAVMAIGSLVSRGTGFLRTAAITAALGTAIGDAYTSAQILPGHGLRVPARRRADQRAGAGAGAPPQARRRPRRGVHPAPAHPGGAALLASRPCSRWSAAPLLTWLVAGGDRPRRDYPDLITALSLPAAADDLLLRAERADHARCSTPAATSPRRCGRRS